MKLTTQGFINQTQCSTTHHQCTVLLTINVANNKTLGVGLLYLQLATFHNHHVEIRMKECLVSLYMDAEIPLKIDNTISKKQFHYFHSFSLLYIIITSFLSYKKGVILTTLSTFFLWPIYNIYSSSIMITVINKL